MSAFLCTRMDVHVHACIHVCMSMCDVCGCLCMIVYVHACLHNQRVCVFIFISYSHTSLLLEAIAHQHVHIQSHIRTGIGQVLRLKADLEKRHIVNENKQLVYCLNNTLNKHSLILSLIFQQHLYYPFSL